MTSLRRSINRRRHWSAWHGSLDELKKIAMLAASQFNKRKEQLVRDYTGSNAVTYREFLQFDITTHMDTDSISGSVSDVFAETDTRRITKVEMTGQFNWSGPPHDALNVTIDCEPNQKAVVLEVSSDDTDWANTTFAQLAEEIKAGVPRYQMMYYDWVRLLIAVATSAAAGWVAYAIAKISNATELTMALIVAFVIVLAFASTIVDKIFYSMFPPIEFVENSNNGKTGRRIAFFASLAASVVIGFIVNYYS